MYAAYATKQGWKLEVLDSSVSDMGGFDSITFTVRGRPRSRLRGDRPSRR